MAALSFFNSLLTPVLRRFPHNELWAFGAVFCLTAWLAATSVRQALKNFTHDRNWARFILYFIATLTLGIVVVQAAYQVVGKVIDATRQLNQSIDRVHGE